MWVLANPKTGEREVLAAMLEVDADLVAEREGILLVTDKGSASKPFEKDLAEQGIELLRPLLKREKKRYGEPMLMKVRQLIESVNNTLKGSLTGTTQRTDLRGRGRPGDPAAPRNGRRYLAQQPDRRTGPPLTDRLRPLIARTPVLVLEGRSAVFAARDGHLVLRIHADARLATPGTRVGHCFGDGLETVVEVHDHR
ncbi:hypothetical protein [Streptomyces sp. NPDC047024]|uniref:hypothetical protein n=1 Tax=Streptomyces sp. NPDC047024 TaxID=3155476 RepID=UPI0033C0F3F7